MTLLSCPLCSNNKIFYELCRVGLDCPICENKSTIPESLYNICTGKNCIGTKLPGSVLIATVSPKLNKELTKVFKAYRLLRIGFSSTDNYSLVKGLEEEFPFKTLPSDLIRNVAPTKLSEFYAYTYEIQDVELIELTEQELVEMDSEINTLHYGVSRGAEESEIIDISRSRLTVAQGIIEVQVEVERVENNKVYIKHTEGKSSHTWIDKRILSQLGLFSTGRLYLYINDNYSPIKRDIFGGLHDFYGEVNPLSIAVLTRNKFAYNEIQRIVEASTSTSYISEPKKESVPLVPLESNNDDGNDDGYDYHYMGTRYPTTHYKDYVNTCAYSPVIDKNEKAVLDESEMIKGTVEGKSLKLFDWEK